MQGVLLPQEKPGKKKQQKKKNDDDNLASKSSVRKLLGPLGQILTDYWDNNSEMDMNIVVLLLKFYWISTGTIYLHI